MGCSPPGAEGGDMRFIPHCAPAFPSCVYGLRPDTQRYAVYMRGFLFSTTLLRLHVRALLSSRCFAAGKRRHVEMIKRRRKMFVAENSK